MTRYSADWSKCTHVICNIIQTMHTSKCYIQICCPEVEMGKLHPVYHITNYNTKSIKPL